MSGNFRNAYVWEQREFREYPLAQNGAHGLIIRICQNCGREASLRITSLRQINYLQD